jgi:hypothetical protein
VDSTALQLRRPARERGLTRSPRVLPLRWTSASFVHERHGFWALHIAGLDLSNRKPRLLDQLPNRTVQMTSPARALPKRSESVLPSLHALFGSQPVLDEQQLAVRFEHATHLVQGERHARNTAQSPRGDYSVHTVLIQRDCLGRAFDEFDDYRTMRGFPLSNWPRCSWSL